VIKARRIRYAEHVTRVGEEKCIQVFGGETSRKQNYLGEVDENGSRVLLNLVLNAVFLSIGTSKKVKVFRYKPEVALGGSRRLRLLDLLDFRHYEGGKVVTLTYRPSLPPGVSWYSFLETESTPGHMVPSVASGKIPSGNTGDRFQDIPTSSAVP
jgi:hypothetical protein